MFEFAADLPSACVRALRTVSARDHSYAEAHRKTAALEAARHVQTRAGRLSRIAARAQARANDLRCEVLA
jgi:hypothetical protein